MKKHTTAIVAASTAAALALAGCGSSEETTDNDVAGADAAGEITFGVFNGWDEAVATSLLWEAILEDKGYDVTLEYADPAPVFQALSDGDYDVTTDVWLPGTHADYLNEFGDSIEELGAWFDSAALTVAVNADSPIDSLADLADNADEFGNRIVGIEPGAGLTKALNEKVIPGYGLEGMEFLTSSTPAMLAELDAAMANGENVIVTLWEPHWAYGAYDIKNLEDPDGALGDAESIYTYSRTGFAADFPDVASWLSSFTMSAELLYDLENLLNDSDDEAATIAEFIADNQEWVDSLTA
ncbi:glycine betaine ABC transporter substrate-binding protein [Demequina pelophila]|uniref:glycine betaine ABC transporter substrate-binding protein n=1 Tax=Demequina pelophila TaxID=1638984 RepID=UPI0007833327|nr:glycine betaine ABC transporter substrate-binding protein [Demequina pelophila]